MQADIYVIQEVCSCDVLKKVIEEMQNGDDYKAYLDPDTAGQLQVGIITKIDPRPIGDDNSKANLKKLEAKPDKRVFRAEFNVGDNKKLALYGAHLVSGLDKATVERRQEVTKAIREKALQDVGNDYYAIIAGDMNTRPDDKKWVKHIVPAAKNNDNVKTFEKEFRTAKLGGFLLKNRDEGGIELLEDKYNYDAGARLNKVIFKQNKMMMKEIDCTDQKLEDLKDLLDQDQYQTKGSRICTCR